MLKSRVGDVDVIALIDSVATYPGATVYAEAGEKLQQYAHFLDADGGVVLNFACFLLREGATTVLVDTGFGPEQQGRLLAELRSAGVEPADIDVVLFTHLHGDHTGWNIDRDTGRPLFSRARYLVPGGDWGHYSKQDPRPASFDRDVVPLMDAGYMELIDGERSITPGVTAVPTPGHTPGHTSALIFSNGERGYVLGDVLISPIDLAEPTWPNRFDWDDDTARATRLRVLESLSPATLVAPSHLPGPGLGFVLPDGVARRWEPLEVGAQA